MKSRQLTEEELTQVSGGAWISRSEGPRNNQHAGGKRKLRRAAGMQFGGAAEQTVDEALPTPSPVQPGPSIDGAVER